MLACDTPLPQSARPHPVILETYSRSELPTLQPIVPFQECQFVILPSAYFIPPAFVLESIPKLIQLRQQNLKVAKSSCQKQY